MRKKENAKCIEIRVMVQDSFQPKLKVIQERLRIFQNLYLVERKEKLKHTFKIILLKKHFKSVRDY